jgi:ketosteroid isomerase-like protein
MSKARIWLLFFAVFNLAGCENMQRQQTVAPKIAPKAEPVVEHHEDRRRVLLDTDMDFARISEEKGAPEAFFEFLAADATLLPEGELPIEGRDAIKVHQAAGPQGLLTWKPRAVEVATGGDLGYTWGSYEFRENSSESRQAIRYGKYVTVWKREPNGPWKAVLLIRNSSPPAGERR